MHGIPGSRVLREGDLISIDCGAQVGLWNGDAAMSLVVGGRTPAAPQDLGLVEDTEASLWAGIAALRVGREPVCRGCRGRGQHHGFGGTAGPGVRHRRGLRRPRHRHVDAHGPAGAQLPRHRGRARGWSRARRSASSRWSCSGTRTTWSSTTSGPSSTRDRSRAAHWEHSVAATSAGLCVLTALDGGEARLRGARRAARRVDPS